jgi:hypothetical protein
MSLLRIRKRLICVIVYGMTWKLEDPNNISRDFKAARPARHAIFDDFVTDGEIYASFSEFSVRNTDVGQLRSILGVGIGEPVRCWGCPRHLSLARRGCRD